MVAHKLMITGASGFLGASLTEQCLADYAEQPCILINSTSSGTPWRLAELWDRVCVHEANLLDPMAVARALAPHPPTHIIHSAAFTHAGRSWVRTNECIAVNAIGTQNLIDAIAGYNSHFCYISTSEVYGTVEGNVEHHLRPQSPYAASKLAGEFLVNCAHQAGHIASARIARVYNLFGAKQWPDRIIPEAIVSALRNEDLKITSGTQRRDFVYVNDAARLILSLAMSDEQIGQTVVGIASGVDRSVRDVASTVFKKIDTASRLIVGALDERPGELHSTSASTTDLNDLGISLTDFHLALHRTITWYQNHLDLF